MPRVTYIGQTPADGTGSPVIVLRHLRRLAADGWQINVIAEPGQDTSACDKAGWPVATLPLRRSWWPPFRADRPILRALRTHLLALECCRLDGNAPPDALLGYLAAHSDFLPEVATRYARFSGVPLSLLIHDDAAAFSRDDAEKVRLRRRHAWILRQAHRCWFVSPELAEAYSVPAAARHVLAPIPAGWNEPAIWRPEFSERPAVYYAGHLWPAQFPLLAAVARILAAAGARLVVLARETPELKTFLAAAPADHIAPFPSNREALAHLARHASGVLVSYTATVAEMPWIATSFPSKLIEYSHLGLPCAIVAPPESAVGRWAARDGGVDFFSPTDPTPLAAWARDLAAAPTWDRRAAPARRLASGEFSPDKIQAMFASHLLRARS